jgi:tetratricopeptide (TPR) repeat protein
VLRLLTLTWIRGAALALLVVAAPVGAAEPPAAQPIAPLATPPGDPSATGAPGEAAAPPQSPQEAEMQAHRAVGHRLYRLGRYEEAVAAFRRAYEVKADARLLFDIAECYREMGAVDQALFYYDRYLAGWPDAFDRAEVDDKVAELEAMRGGGAPRTAVAARRRHPLMITEPPPSKARQTPRVWQRWWFWTAIGAVVLGGVGVAVASSGSGTSVPATDLGNKRFF